MTRRIQFPQITSHDRPLVLIYQNIRHYWQGQSPDDDWDGDAMPRRSAEGIKPTKGGSP